MKISTLFSGLAAVAAAGALVVTNAFAAGTVVVSGNTSAGENQPGWLFNRDVTTMTPFEFNNDQQSIGEGSLYVQPIGANASDKFVGENFINSLIADVDSVSYDFKIGSGGDATDEEQFYMNVYANFGESDDLKFYDCRYNVVPTVGSTTDWTTVTFDPTQAYPVTTRGGASASPYTCPAVPADMDLLSTGSNIRMFSLNVGDTSVSDVGLDGYLDNVVVTKNADATTYDFEMPDTEAPDVELTAPADGSVVSGVVDVRGTVTDDNLWRYYTVVRDATNVVVAGPGTVNEDNSFTDQLLFSWDTTVVADGVYTVRLEARDDFNQKDAGSVDVHTVTVSNVVVSPTPTPTVEPTPSPSSVPMTKEECKKSGWSMFGFLFRNQGQCIAKVQSNENSKHNQ